MHSRILIAAGMAFFLAVCCAFPGFAGGEPTVVEPLRRYTWGIVNGAAFSPDATTFVTAGTGGVFLREVPGGRVLRSFGEAPFAAEGVVFSPDGKTIVTYGYSRGVSQWDIATGERIRTFANSGVCPVFSPDGKLLLTGGGSSATLWDVSSGAHVRDYSQPQNNDTHSLAFSPDGKCLATGGGDSSHFGMDPGMLRVWDISSDALLRLYVGQPHTIVTVAFSPDGKRIVTGGRGNVYTGAGTVRLWDAASTATVRVIAPHDDPVTFVGTSRDGSKILTGSFSEARLWNSDLTKQSGRYAGSPLAFSASGSLVLTKRGNDICLWNTTSGVLTATYREYWAQPFFSLSVSATRMLTMGETSLRSVQLWDVISGAPLINHDPAAFSPSGQGGYVDGCALSRDGGRIFTCDRENGGLLWDDVSTSPLMRYPYASGSAAFSPDGRGILTGALRSFTLNLWDTTASPTLRQSFAGESSISLYPANYFCFSRDNRLVLSGTGDTALLWNAANGESLANYTSKGSSIYSVALSANGKRGVAGCADGIRIWDMESRTLLRTIDAAAAQDTFNVAISPDGKRILSANASGAGPSAVRLWMADTGECVRVFRAHTSSRPISVAFSPNGTTAFTAGEDGLLLQWDATVSTGVRDWEQYGTMRTRQR